ncbi:MAG TPA: helix-turn-helix domain-containing protein [Candidatus Dormibacteraeota bacterium]|nr:helix-turn-helix domain-containing protein [Candidatus Dormibacteraeota bacterium]
MSELPSTARAGLATALDRVGDRWALLLVESLLGGPRRYSDLKRDLPTIASNVLSERLRRLELAGVVESQRYSARPPRAEYRLTAAGRGLAAVIDALDRWGGRDGAPGPIHPRCGTPMEPRFYCPTCDELVVPGEVTTDDEVVFA